MISEEFIPSEARDPLGNGDALAGLD